MILRREGDDGGLGEAPSKRVLVMSGAVKIFTLNTALWDMSGGESERRRAVMSFLPSLLPSLHFSPLPACRRFLLACFPSDKVGQHYTSVQHAGGRGEGGFRAVREIDGEDRQR